AAERHRRVHRLIAIDPHRTGANASRQLVRLADVPGPDARTEAELGLVAAFYDFFDVSERNSGDYRAENLLLRDAHIIPHIGEHSWRNEESLGHHAFHQTFTARQRFRALLPADGEVAGDARQLLLRDQRADLSFGITGITDAQRFAERGD